MPDPIALTSEERFMEAYETYADALFRHCYLRVLDREKAKAMVTEAFRQTWHEMGRGSPIDNARLFLYRTANTLVAQERRDNPVTQPAAPMVQIAGTSSVTEEHVLARVGQLEADHRDVLVLHFVDRFSKPDIAAIIGESLQTVTARLAEGVRRLHSSLQYA